MMRKKILFIATVLILINSILIFAQMHFKENRELTSIEKNSLFDILIDIPSQYQKIEINDDILFSIKLVNLGSEGRIDVLLDYGIKDKNNNLLLHKTETIAVETQATFVRQLDLTGISPGKYKIIGKITYADGKIAETTNSFEIVESERKINADLVGWIIIGVLIAGFIILLIYKSKPLIEKILIRARIKKIVNLSYKETFRKELPFPRKGKPKS